MFAGWTSLWALNKDVYVGFCWVVIKCMILLPPFGPSAELYLLSQVDLLCLELFISLLCAIECEFR